MPQKLIKKEAVKTPKPNGAKVPFHWQWKVSKPQKVGRYRRKQKAQGKTGYLPFETEGHAYNTPSPGCSLYILHTSAITDSGF
jgi:hypothetical protein